jgi:hypothetical protein
MTSFYTPQGIRFEDEFELNIDRHGHGADTTSYSVSIGQLDASGNYLQYTRKNYYRTFASRNEAFDFCQAVARGEVRLLKADWF